MSKRRKQGQNCTFAASIPFCGIIKGRGLLQFANDEHDMLDIQLQFFFPRKPRQKKKKKEKTHDTNEQFQ